MNLLRKRILIVMAGLVFLQSLASATRVSPNGAALTRSLKLVPHHISLASGRSFDLNLPEGFAISVAAQGLKRVRFMAQSPDGRIFVTDMYNLTDNKKGVVYILEDFDFTRKTFNKVTAYLKGLRNPNSIAFYTDAGEVNWLYVALTDHLVRYKYDPGDKSPQAPAEILATFPDYGLSYKYGGWHLTRTIVVGGNGKLYVSIGSSCNACEETEEVRASVLEMDPDGKHQRQFVKGLRNAVGLRWIKDRLFATNMGPDHLGDHKPADTMYSLEDGMNYGWPYCYQSGPGRFPDPKFNRGGKKMSCRNVPRAYAAFDAHSSPLGFEYFDQSSSSDLRNSFLVALHGSTKKELNRGYRVVRVRGNGSTAIEPEDFIDGFLSAGKVNGRPADVFRFGQNGFLLTDDNAGAVYYVYEK